MGSHWKKEVPEPSRRVDIALHHSVALHKALRHKIRAATVSAPLGEQLARRTKALVYIQQLEKILRDAPQLDITLSDVAYILDMEKTYCSKVFSAVVGSTLCQWKRSIRIDCAKDLLRCSNRSITDIGHAVGYSDVTTFERNFQKQVGMCPRSFRELHTDTPSPAHIKTATESLLGVSIESCINT